MDIQIGNKILQVTLLSKEGNKVSIDIDGEIYNVDVAMLQNGVYSIIHDGYSYNAELSRNEGSKHYTVNLNYSSYPIDILDSQAKYMRLRKNKHKAVQGDTITVPMPCKIVKVYVKPGDEVKTGDTLFTMEAMKMQSNYKVASDCVIKSVMVQDGDTVKGNDVVMTLDLTTPEE